MSLEPLASTVFRLFDFVYHFRFRLSVVIINTSYNFNSINRSRKSRK